MVSISLVADKSLKALDYICALSLVMGKEIDLEINKT
jgi:hypothetical protein